MHILTPISSYQTSQSDETILIDSNQLAEWFGLNRNVPKVVCKTNIRGDLKAGWDLYILENNQYNWLLGSNDTTEESVSLDVIPLIGHKLMLMPWQKLVFIIVL